MVFVNDPKIILNQAPIVHFWDEDMGRLVPNSDLEKGSPFSIRHCEHLKGVWQSHREKRDCFARKDRILNLDLGG